MHAAFRVSRPTGLLTAHRMRHCRRTSTPPREGGFCRGHPSGLHTRVSPFSVLTVSFSASTFVTDALIQSCCPDGPSSTHMELPMVWVELMLLCALEM